MLVPAGNMDRHHYETFEKFGNETFIIHLDNGRGWVFCALEDPGKPAIPHPPPVGDQPSLRSSPWGRGIISEAGSKTRQGVHRQGKLPQGAGFMAVAI